MNDKVTKSVEQVRLDEANAGLKKWHRWGPYLSERQWGPCAKIIVRMERPGNISRTTMRAAGPIGGAKTVLAVSAIARQRLCFSVALWNGKDPILKERLFGLTNERGQSRRGCEGVYYYLDATPTHSYLKMLYKYPQA